jgi:hypothetical protein
VTYADGSYVPDEGGKLSFQRNLQNGFNGEILISDWSALSSVTETKTIPGYTMMEIPAARPL